MSRKKKKLSVLIDTSFIIALYDTKNPNQQIALKYFKYFIGHSITMYLSTIVISEFHQKESIVEVINTENYHVLPFNYDDSITVADIVHKLGKSSRNSEVPRAEFKDDIKLMAQAVVNKIDYIITDDESTLARYCKKLSEASVFDPQEIVIKDGFQASIFNDGQTSLLDSE